MKNNQEKIITINIYSFPFSSSPYKINLDEKEKDNLIKKRIK